MSQLTEEDVERVKKALNAALKSSLFVEVPQIIDVLDELDSWLFDDRQWHKGNSSNWISLIDDLRAAIEDLGPRLSRTLHDQNRAISGELKRIRAEFNDNSPPPDGSLRRRLTRLAAALRESLIVDEALRGAWGDLLAARGWRQSRAMARILLRLAESRGHAGESLATRLGRILTDNAHALAVERGEKPEEGDFHRSANSTIEERLALADVAIVSIPQLGEAVVWLLYAFAPRLWPPALEVGARVTLYDVEWLRSVMQSGNAAYPLPPELEADPQSLSLLLPPLDPEPPREGPLPPLGPTPKENEEVPRVAVRLDLGSVQIAEAEALARSSAEALVALADLHGAESPWVIEDSFSMYIDGRHGAWSFAAPAAFLPTTTQHVAMSSDITSKIIDRNAERWGPHFPVRDPGMQQATHLLIWLRKAREAWAPGRLILCDRVIERVAGWAGVSSPRRLVDDHLKLPWALHQMRSELAGIAWAAFNALGDVGHLDKAAQEHFKAAHDEIRWDPDLEFDFGESSWKVNEQAVVGKLKWLAERVPDDSPAHERAEYLRRRLAGGKQAAAWAEELMREFKTIDARARRLRNTLIHGGPATERVAEETLPFVESIAVDALNISIEGRFDGVDLIDFFLNRRARAEAILTDLRSGADPAKALWPDARAR
jgi:hypothetical protein